MKALHSFINLLLRRPLYVTLYVTKCCDFKCQMCAVREQHLSSQIDLGKVREIARRLKKLGLLVVNIGGGEPLLVKQLSEIVEIFKDGFTVRMQTNAYSADAAVIQRLAQAGLDAVSVSLHSIVPEKQDSLCGVKGAWLTTVGNMILFRKYLPARSGLMIMNSVVSSLNMHEIDSLIRFGNYLGYYNALIPLLHADNLSKEYIYRAYSPHLAPEEAELPVLDGVYSRVVAMKRYRYKLANSTAFLRKAHRYHGDRHMRWGCDAGRLYFVLNHRGDFSICTELPPIGNILDDSFYSRYKAGELHSVMDQAIARCPNCFHPCFTEISLMRQSPRALLEQTGKIIRAMRGGGGIPSYAEVISFHERLLKRSSS